MATEKRFFSEKTKSFYIEGKNKNIPSDAIEISEDHYNYVLYENNLKGRGLDFSGGTVSLKPINIDSVKKAKLKTIVRKSEKFVNDEAGGYPKFEKQIFEIQKTEAIAWKNDNNTKTVNIDRIALAKGIAREELILKILKNVADFQSLVIRIIGQKQKFEDKLSKLTTKEQIDAMEIEFY